MPRKKCIEIGCESYAIDKTGKCKRHGGGKRCDEPECQASAEGKTDKCKRHGGGTRCSEPRSDRRSR